MTLPRDFRRRLEEVLACPTAPFHEGKVHAVIRAAVKAAPRLRDRIDAFGNLEVVYGPGRPRLFFTCHTDHPALETNGDGTARILGGMKTAALKGARLRTLHEPGPVATVGAVVRNSKPVAVRLKGGKGLAKGTPLVLDLKGPRFENGRIRAVAVDDLCSVAACLALFDRLQRERWKGTVGALFTRAEEVGFGGALAWARHTRVPKRTTVINLEMSPARRHTPQGAGPILRVGDRITTFIQGVGVELEWAAKALAQRVKGFRYQRALMDGGACEATVFTFGGFRTGALCLPLKHAHNAVGSRMGLESVDAGDAHNLLQWMVEYTKTFGGERPHREIAGRLDKLRRRHQSRLRRSAAQGKGA